MVPAASLSFGLTPSQPSTVYPPHSDTNMFHLSLIVSVGVHSTPVWMVPAVLAEVSIDRSVGNTFSRTVASSA